MIRIEEEGAVNLPPPLPLPPGRNLWSRFRDDDDVEPSEVPRRQPEQRWSLAEDGAEPFPPGGGHGEEKTSLGGPDKVEQPDPPDRERRDVTQDSQAGTGGRRKAARTENAQRAV